MNKILVAYFSATGTTRQLAEKLAKAADATLHEIIPETVYTTADLDWRNAHSRSSKEMKDKSFRPAIANRVDDIDQYDIIFIAFPIWWYVAPTIINTFLEQYNLEGKMIIPVATSGGSSIGNTNQELLKSCHGAILKTGRVFSASVSENDLKQWIKDTL